MMMMMPSVGQTEEAPPQRFIHSGESDSLRDSFAPVNQILSEIHSLR